MDYFLEDRGLIKRLRPQGWARRINPYLERLNTAWAWDTIGIPLGYRKGPDLFVPGEKAVEIKWTWRGPGSAKSQKWTVDHKALRYSNLSRQCYWAFGIFDLDAGFQELRSARTQIELISHIKYRTLCFTEWPYVEDNFEWHHVKGKSKTKEWSTFLAYVHSKKLPRISETFKVKDGEINLTRGVSAAIFPNLRGAICGNAGL